MPLLKMKRRLVYEQMAAKPGRDSSDNNIRQRAWYYTKVFVDPKNENTVYAPM